MDIAVRMREIRTQQVQRESSSESTVRFDPLAQYSDSYFGCWYEEDDSDYYYWFTADEVYVDDSWFEYY